MATSVTKVCPTVVEVELVGTTFQGVHNGHKPWEGGFLGTYDAELPRTCRVPVFPRKDII